MLAIRVYPIGPTDPDRWQEIDSDEGFAAAVAYLRASQRHTVDVFRLDDPSRTELTRAPYFLQLDTAAKEGAYLGKRYR